MPFSLALSVRESQREEREIFFLKHCFLYNSCRMAFFLVTEKQKKIYIGSWSTMLFISI